MRISKAVCFFIMLTDVLADTLFELVLPLGQTNFDILKRKDIKIWSELGSNKFLVSKLHDRGRELILNDRSEKPYIPTHNHHNSISKFIIQYVKLEPIKDGLLKKLPRQTKISWHLLPSSQVILSIDSVFSNVTRFYLANHPSVVHFDFIRPIKHHTYFGEQVISPHVLPRWGGSTTLAVMDTGLDFNHCYFSSTPQNWLVYNGVNGQQLAKLMEKGNKRLMAYIKMELFDGVDREETDFDALPDDHGTHTAGTAVGDDSNCNLKQGLYSKTKLVFIDAAGSDDRLVVPSSLTDMLEMLYTMGVRVFSNSWGSDHSTYGYQSMEMDAFLYTHEDFIIVQSAGNSGPEIRTIASPAVFKNGIAVGASQNSEKSFNLNRKTCWEGNNTYSFVEHHMGGEENLADFSSRGPTDDGRTKPDFLAPGRYILSARARKGTRDELLYMQGTSMSAPLLARTVTHLIEWCERQGVVATGYLIKSIFATLSKPLTGHSTGFAKNKTTIMKISHGPLPIEGVGWGRISLEGIDKLHFKDRIPIDTFTQFSLCLKSEKTQTTRVSISWYDPPGRIGKGGLIYDLNLQVQINGKVWTPLDTKNNIERVELTVYKGEIMRITVSVYSTARTKFALSYIGSFIEQPCGECTTLSPPLQCSKGGEIGGRGCVNGKWTDECLLWCHQKWYYFKNECVCLHDTPSSLINSIDNSNILSTCKNGSFIPAKEFFFKTQKRTVDLSRSPPIRRLLARSPGVNWGVVISIVIAVGGAIGFVYFKINKRRL